MFKNQEWILPAGLSTGSCLKCNSVLVKGATNIKFLSKTEWPPSSPDLNPLDYSVWGNLERRACAKPHKSLESLLNALNREWNDMPQEELRAAVLQFRTRVKSVVTNKGGYIE